MQRNAINKSSNFQIATYIQGSETGRKVLVSYFVARISATHPILDQKFNANFVVIG